MNLHIIKAFHTAKIEDGDFMTVEMIVGANISMTSPTKEEVRKRLRHEAHVLPRWLGVGNKEGRFGAYYRPREPFNDHVKRMIKQACEGAEVPSPYDKVYLPSLLDAMDRHLVLVVRKSLVTLRRKAVLNGTLTRARVLDDVIVLVNEYIEANSVKTRLPS